MNKITILICSLIAIGGFYLILTNVNQEPKSTTQTISTEQSKVTKVEQVESKLKRSGIKIAKKTDAYYTVLGALDGAKYGSGEENAMEIYVFSDSSKANETKKLLQTQNNTVIVSSNFIVAVHTKDPAITEKIELALK